MAKSSSLWHYRDYDRDMAEPFSTVRFRDSYRAQAPISLHAYAELDQELRDNEQKQFHASALADSVHTEFQEDYNEGFHDEDERLATTRALDGVDEYDPPPRRPYSGYMDRTTPFSLDHSSPPNERSFMEWYPEGDATLSFPGEDGEIVSIHHINIWMIEERSQLLATAFESSRSGPQLYLDTLSSATAIPFLRYLYTGNYALTSASGDYYEDVPTSVLLHCQLYRLAHMYELPELKSQAYVNVLRQCEFGCSSPNKPIDLCAAIRYSYQHLREHEKLIDAIVHYCVSCFLTHRLAQDAEFRQLAFELRPFHQTLCRNVMERGFEDEAAAAIIQMPYKPHAPETYASREDIGCTKIGFDDVYHFHSIGDNESSPKKRKRAEPVPPPSRTSNLTLALRPAAEVKGFVTDDSASEEEDFRVVRRRTSELPTGFTAAPASLSDEDFDVVQDVAQVEVLDSDEDTDTESVVHVQLPIASANNGTRALPVRSRDSAATAAKAEHVGADSDSEWSVI